jgi:hypothetical protein
MFISSLYRTLPLILIFARPASEYCICNIWSFLTFFTRKIHNLDNTYHVASYVHNTSTLTCRTHAFTENTDIYLEEAEHQCWHVLHKSSQLKTFLDEGWTIATMHQRLRDPDCMLHSLSTPPSPDLLPGTSLSAPDDALPAFTLDEMHKQIVKFIIGDDQVSQCALSTLWLIIVYRQSISLNAQNFDA